MKQRPRIYYTESQKAIMWDRWQKGESLQQIAQLFDRNHSSVQGILAQCGGIRPAPRRRSSLALTLVEREEISRALASGHSARSIAVLLERAPSTISREIKRNGGQGCYRANQADQAAWDRACRPKTCRLAENPMLARIVAAKLQLLSSRQYRRQTDGGKMSGQGRAFAAVPRVGPRSFRAVSRRLAAVAARRRSV